MSLTVEGPGGTDTLTRPAYITVVKPNQSPVVTISSPAEGAVVRSGAVQISGAVADDGAVVSVVVNDIPAPISDGAFTVVIPFENGNHIITVTVTDDVGAVGVVSRMVRVDGAGPLIGILAPKRGQAVYMLQPDIAISYSDFSAAVDAATLHVQLVDANGGGADITSDLTITSDRASGVLSTPLTGDMRYTLTVSLADTLGNVSQSEAAFYVPSDLSDLVPPVEPEDAGWVSGVVYDSSVCNEHLTTCEPLPGARVTLSRAGSLTDAIPGTILSGPDGFFAFPVGETTTYWLRVAKDGYTYAQREVEIVRQHSTATDEIYLTPLDPALTLCDAAGCSHASSDGMLQVEIPAGAIAPGQVVPVTATNFRNVEFLPSGSLPEGTWETYAFNLGGDSEVSFAQPMTVKIRNYRGFATGEEIPLGYWNQYAQAWEPEGFGIVDAAGVWVVMSLTHFSNYDCNYTVLLPPVGAPPKEPQDLTNGSGPGDCADGEGKCFIDFESGTFTEDYALPAVNMLGQDVAPQLVYNSRRAHPNALIDLEFRVEPQAGLLDYAEFEVYIEGKKTDNIVVSSPTGARQRYRYLWDGRDSQGRLMPPGVYRYQSRLKVPYRAQYYRAYRFGGQLNPAYPTGVFVNATYDYWTSGTILLNSQSDSPLGAGWAFSGQQRVYGDDSGRLLISDGARNAEFQRDRDGLVAWYPFDEENAGLTPDESGNGHDGTVNGATLTADRFGNPARAYRFDGENDIINLGSPPALDEVFDGVHDVTFSAWVTIEDTSTYRALFTKGNVGSCCNYSGVFAFTYDKYLAEKPVFTIYDGNWNSGFVKSWSRADFPLNQWVHFTLRYEASPYNAEVYLNGHKLTSAHVEQRGYNGSVIENIVAADLKIGGEFVTSSAVYPGKHYWKGLIDDVRIYNRALSAEEIQALYTTPDAGPTHYRALTATDHSWLEYAPDAGTYTRFYPDGTRVHFNPDGTHDYTLDRQGNKTAYTYNPDVTTSTMSITPAGETTPRWTWTFSYHSGKLSRITDPAGRVTTFTIDGRSHLTAVSGPDNATRRFAYDARGLMTHETDENGNITTHIYDRYGRISKVLEPPRPVFDPASGQTTLQREILTFTPSDTSYPLINDSPVGDPDNPAPAVPTSDDLIAGVQYGRGGRYGRTDKWGRWLDKTDGLGRTTTYQRDAAGNLLRRDYPDGSCDEYSYNSTGDLLYKSRMGAAQCALPPDQRDPAQVQTTRYTYDLTPGPSPIRRGETHLKTKTDPLGQVTTYVYDYEEGVGEAGNLIRIEYPAVEDEFGNPVTPTTRYTYNQWGLVETETGARGTVTHYVYTQGTPAEAGTLFAPGVTPVPGLLTQVIKDASGENQTTAYSNFDAAGNPGTVSGPGCCGSGQVTQYTYDALGRVLTKTDALGMVTKYEYDPKGNVRRTIADYTPDGITGRNVATEYAYDAQDHLLTRRTMAEGILSETRNAYDVNGKLAAQTDAKGQTTTYSYDDANQLVAVTDPVGNMTRYTYTLKGEVETTTLPNDTVIRYVYDEFGRKIEEIADESGLNLTTTYSYDLSGNQLTVTDANQKTTTSAYDALNRLKTVEDPLAQTTGYRYDLAGNLRFLTDAEQHATEFAYNALNQVTQERRPMGEITTYAYNEAGKLREKRDAKQQITTYTYNETTGQLTQIGYADGKIVTFTYNRAGNLSGYADGTTSATYTYDALGRKLTETVNYGALTKTFRYSYYADGQKQTFTMPGGPTYSYTYHDNNELKKIRIPGVGDIEYPSYTMNRPNSVTFPGGSQQTFQYDSLVRLQQTTASSLNYAYTYDNLSNILTKSTEHGEYGYVYDDVSRLTNAESPTQAPEAYFYDGVGNRLPSLVTSPIVHNENNELLAYGEMQYEYDANGNLIRKSLGMVAVNYSYDAANRLIKVEDDLSGFIIAEYGYDPFGRRLWKDVNGVRTYFLYADEGLVAEYDASGNEIRSYGYQPDSTWTTNPLWLKENGQYYWYQNDHLGTPQKLVDRTGTVVWEALYEAFGKAEVQVETIINNLRFPGQYFDAETGLHYNWFRYYDPGIGRYLQADPIGFEGDDVNLYAYVWNSPVNWRDTMGLRTCGEYKQKFFNWLKDYVPQMAKDLNVPEDLLWTLAVKEGGWSEEPIINDPENPGKKISAFLRNIRENMPFGVQDPKTEQNKKYDSLEEAIEDWKITGVGIPFGDRVQGVQTIQEFIDALQCKGKPPEECRPYNTDSKEAWESLMNTLYGNLTGDKYGAGYKEVCTEPCGLEGGGSDGQ